MESPASTQSRFKSRRRWRGTVIVVRLLASLLFVLGIYGSIRLGITMASNRVPDLAERSGTEPIAESTPLTLGGSGDPIYLADNPDSLRTFFNNYPTPGERASADLRATTLRRVTGEMDMTTLRVEADAIQVRVTSGPIAGAEYWIHHSQTTDSPEQDPIISPLPSQQE